MMSKARSAFVWNVLMITMTATVRKSHTNGLSQRDRVRGIPLGRGDEESMDTDET
jgi:hypothetical protein